MTEVRLIYADAQKAKIAVDALSGHKKICVCGLIDDATTIPDIDRAAIMRLCNEIEEIVTAIANWSENWQTVDDCRTVCDKLKEIGKELTGDAGTD